VLETLLSRTAIQRSEGRELIDLRGEPLLLRHLAREFDLPAEPAGESLFVIVLGIGEQRVGLAVDRLYGQQDTVIKPIQGPSGDPASPAPPNSAIAAGARDRCPAVEDAATRRKGRGLRRRARRAGGLDGAGPARPRGPVRAGGDAPAARLWPTRPTRCRSSACGSCGCP
jgi:hypothetical protein